MSLANQRPILYSSATDVGNVLNTTFSTTTTPTTAQVQDIIARGDSYIDSVSGHNWLTNQVVDEYHDAISGGPRSGTVILNFRPVISIQKFEWWNGGQLYWYPGQQGFPDETTGKLVGPSNQLQQPESFYAYLPEGKLVWHKVRLDGRLMYRVSYTWGYSSVPDFVRDLSMSLAGLELQQFYAGLYLPAEGVDEWTDRLRMKIARLTWQAARRTAVSSLR